MTKFYKYLLVFFGLIFSVSYCAAQTLDIYVKITSSNEYLLKEKIKYSDSIELNNILQQNKLSDIAQAYVLAGYDSIIYDDINVKAYYNKGTKYVWEKFSCNDTLLTKHKLPKVSDNFDPDMLYKELNKLLYTYADNGFPFAVIKMDSLSFVENKVIGKIKIEQGNKY
ncbi:MAG TPA: hypothetical protein PLL66_08290, partial [Bacteroidales bacterium]|nr:hypothetical protein [Bacteroidales bacterium]